MREVCTHIAKNEVVGEGQDVVDIICISKLCTISDDSTDYVIICTQNYVTIYTEYFDIGMLLCYLR